MPQNEQVSYVSVNEALADVAEERFEIEDVTEMDTTAPFNVYTSSCSSTCCIL